LPATLSTPIALPATPPTFAFNCLDVEGVSSKSLWAVCARKRARHFAAQTTFQPSNSPGGSVSAATETLSVRSTFGWRSDESASFAQYVVLSLKPVIERVPVCASASFIKVVCSEANFVL
jgi:hypothetical protein